MLIGVNMYIGGMMIGSGSMFVFVGVGSFVLMSLVIFVGSGVMLDFMGLVVL